MSLSNQLNQQALEVVTEVIRHSESLDVVVHKIDEATVLDFGADRVGNRESGILLARICMANRAEINTDRFDWHQLDKVIVKTHSPVEACIGSQYAGWPLANDEYFAMCSGPIRLPRGKEEILSDSGFHVEPCQVVVGVLESNKLPVKSIIQLIVAETGVSPNNIYLCVARTASLPGSLQVVARSVETTMHKLHELGFDLRLVKQGVGSAPVPPIPNDDMVALGWTNDAILYGGKVELWVDAPDDQIETLIQQIPSCSSKEFGTPFLDLFKKYECDFYRIDKMLFSPAQVTLNCLASGRQFEAGQIRPDILASSFGID